MDHVIYGNKLKFKRVSYAKKDIPLEEREYRLVGIGSSPVGTINEIFQMVRDQNLDVNRLEFEDLDNVKFHYTLSNGKWVLGSEIRTILIK